MADIKHIAALVPISIDLLGDSHDLHIEDRIVEYLTYGQPRTHRNPMPHFVFFPRVQKIIDAWSRLRAKSSDAIYAFRYGIPDPDGY